MKKQIAVLILSFLLMAGCSSYAGKNTLQEEGFTSGEAFDTQASSSQLPGGDEQGEGLPALADESSKAPETILASQDDRQSATTQPPSGGEGARLSEETPPIVPEPDDEGIAGRMIYVNMGETAIIFQLNDSAAARALYDQLPLSTEVENYSDNEKIFYLPTALDTGNTPVADGGIGTLAYYVPWGNVAIFYGNFSSDNNLYELGQVISGGEYIQSLSGVIEVTKE